MTTKVLFISDTHGLHQRVGKLPDADVLVHAGDFMNSGRSWAELVEFWEWLDSLYVPEKLVVAGNHDILLQGDHWGSNAEIAQKAKDLLATNCKYLENEAIEVKGIKFYLSPVTPTFGNWAFNVDRGAAIKRYWDRIPEDTEVLITHGPPYGILDKIRPDSEYSPHLGCEELTKRVGQLRSLKVHVFGHIHGSRGTWQHHTNGLPNGPLFVNASFLDERYKPYFGPSYTLVEI